MKPKLSIITVTCNGWKNTRELVRSIRRYTPMEHEVIVVSNGEPAAIDADKVISNGSNLGWTRGVNQGIAVAEGEYVIWMNDDTEATGGWAESLLWPLKRIGDVGLVGPTTNYASGPQQLPYSFWLRSNRDVAMFQRLPRLVGFCVATSARVIEEVGGLDERFATYGFDDDDYSLRVMRAGFTCVIAHAAFVHHKGHETYKREHIDLGGGLLKGWELFKEKWGLDAHLPYGSPIPYDRLIMEPWNDNRDVFPLGEATHAAQS